MKPPRPSISSTEYLVHPAPRDTLEAVARKLDGVGSVEPLPGHADWLVVRLSHPPRDARQGWECLCRSLGGEAAVMPVFLDDDETPKYAVGVLQVRFPSPLTDAELSQWLPPGLRLKCRNEFVPAQVSLEPAAPTEQYLPELLAAVEAHCHDGRIKVWPETLQPFRRT